VFPHSNVAGSWASLFFHPQKWASAGGCKTSILPLEIGAKNQTFLENMKSAAQFRLIDLISAMTIYLPE